MMTIHSTDIARDEAPGIDRRQVNGALTGARNLTLLALIGNPRGSYAPASQEPTNPEILCLLESADFGLFRARGLRPAVEALHRVLRDIALERPDIFPRIGCAGMLGCRLARGSDSAISSHSWGIAIDLTLDGRTEGEGVPEGLRAIQPIFNRHGFYWGAAFPVAEPMHFEASEQLIRKWAAEGRFMRPVPRGLPLGLSFGDRGMAVADLQKALIRRLPQQIGLDGVFGRDTRAAVIEFQRRAGLVPDGIAGRKTLKALGLG
jgi:hypothetical protein